MKTIRAVVTAVVVVAMPALGGATTRKAADISSLRDAIAVSPSDVIAAVVEPEQSCEPADPMCVVRVRVVDLLLQRHKSNPRLAAGDSTMLYVGSGAESRDVKLGGRILVVGTPLHMHPDLVGYTARAMTVSPDDATTGALRTFILATTW